MDEAKQPAQANDRKWKAARSTQVTGVLEEQVAVKWAGGERLAEERVDAARKERQKV